MTLGRYCLVRCFDYALIDLSIKIKGFQQSYLCVSSDEVLFLQDFVDGFIAFSGTSDKSTDGDDVDIGEVDGSIRVESADG